MFYSHVNYSVTKIWVSRCIPYRLFYSHVNYSVTKIFKEFTEWANAFYSHVNYSVTKMPLDVEMSVISFTVT